MEDRPEKYELLVPYLRSCKKEVLEPVPGDVKGSIPSWLQGTLLRVGAGLLEVGADKYNHVFDGMALMHRFAIQDGGVTYENRFLRSEAYQANMKAKRITVSEFGTRARPDPCKSIFRRFASLFSWDGFTDNDLVNFVKYTDQYYACSETNYIWKVNPDTLETVEKVDLSKFVLLNTATAHPHEDTDGSVYNVGYGFLPTASYVFIKFPRKEDAASNPFLGGSVVSKIPASRRMNPSYFHSFGMSENYFIFLEQSLELSVPKLMYTHFTWTAYAESLTWHKERKARFHVVRRDTGELVKTKYLTGPLMVFHHINAYEEDGHLVVDVCWSNNGDVIKTLYVESLKKTYGTDNNGAKLLTSYGRRFVLPLCEISKTDDGKNLVTLQNSEAKAVLQKDGHVFLEPEKLVKDDVWASEMPRINYRRCNGRKYRYYYSIGRSDGTEETAVIKVDTENKTVLYWEEEGALPSEPVFVPSLDAEDEDDGVVLVSVLCKSDLRKVCFLVLDAKSMTELGRADFHTESTVPGDFHGIFISRPTQQ